MTRFNFVCVFIVATCFSVVLTVEDPGEDYQEQNIRERAVGRSYSLTTCDYQSQIGYTCLSCSRALHCYVGNVAIIVDCYGIFRYCRDGRCSRHQGEKCLENKATTTGPFNTTITPIDAASIATSSEATTKLLTQTTQTVAATATESAATVAETVAATAAETVAVTVAETVAASVAETVAATVTETIIITVDEKSTTNSETAATESETATTKSDVSTTVAVEPVDVSSNVV